MHNKLRTDSLLHIENVYKAYNGNVILDNIDLSVFKKEFITLVGPSGCGKSTLFRLISGAELPTSFEDIQRINKIKKYPRHRVHIKNLLAKIGIDYKDYVITDETLDYTDSANNEMIFTMDGKDVGFPDQSRGIVFQRYGLFPHLTAIQNIGKGKFLQNVPFLERQCGSYWLYKKLYGTPNRNVLREECLHILERVGLKDHANKFPHELSGGQQQRIAIAQALIMKPKILLMDEPFGALDPGTREDLQVFLLELWEEYGLTIIFVTHDLDEAILLGTRCVVISQYYQDDRQFDELNKQKKGATIVSDYDLGIHTAKSTNITDDPIFRKLRHKILNEGFDPQYRQHINDFNLDHPNSFSTP
ncbi:MAG: ABC transporter ATP-binding protein [Mariprofundales bacterium]